MTVIWLIVWLIKDSPTLEFAHGNLNDWAVALVVCILIDALGSNARRKKR